jgi:hypothetical protein
MEMEPGGEVDAAKDTPMHALKIAFAGADKLVAEWTAFEGGQTKSVSTFMLARVK